MTKIKRAHGFAAVRAEGRLLPPEFLRDIASQKARYQADADYRISRSLQLKDELGRYWHIARDLWKVYQQRRHREDLDAHAVANEFLVSFFRDVLGYYDIQPVRGATAEGRHFAITHTSAGGQIPFLFVPHRFDLDRAEARFGEGGHRRSPANLVQEYLNADERAQWGLVSNGSVIRLMRDNPSLTRPAYIECDLELMLTDEIYADFTAMWLLLHDSRLRREGKRASAFILEQWRLQAHETGERALDQLRGGVTEALRILGSGFVAHSANEALRERVASGVLTAPAYYRQLLRLVYRFLFLFTVEDRDLLFPAKVKQEKRQVYAEGYSLGMLRERALRRGMEEQHSDFWQGLQIVFRGLAGDETVQDALGLPALDGLFAAGECPDLDEAQVGNSFLLKAVRALAYFRTESGLARINYRDMDTEELGSVYEGLLELHPQFLVESRPWGFGFVSDMAEIGARGSERKATGSYYTPSSLVDELIKSALEPVMEKAVADHPEDPRQAILDLKVIDPACGSGHFLLAAARRMAAEIARLEADGSAPDEQVRRHALREVVQHCIYGVDKNPLAVELCRAALWMETIEPGKPLSFLDSHIQWGDSLIGLRDPSVLSDGIPMDAYKPLTGDEPAAEKELKRRNKGSVYDFQLDIFQPTAVSAPNDDDLDIEVMPEETVADLAAKRAQWAASRRRRKWMEAKDAADMFVAAFFLPKRMDCIDAVPANQDLARLVHKQPARPGVLEAVRRVAEAQGFFHWHLAFPQVMKRGGFEVVLGNPPWERVKLQEEEFFAGRSPTIAAAPNKAARERLIRGLGGPSATTAERTLLAEFEEARRAAQATGQFLRTSGRFPLMGAGDVNTYAVFVETAYSLLSERGRAGMVVPGGIATDATTKRFFDAVMRDRRLVSLYSFFEIRKWFPGTDDKRPFALMTLGSEPEGAAFAFDIRGLSDLEHPAKQFRLSAEDVRLINPNSRTCPIFRSQADADLTRKLYTRFAVLIDRGGEAVVSPWGLSFLAMVHSSSDSELYRSRQELLEMGAKLVGSNWVESDGARWVPLMEARMIHQYDHRFGTYEGMVERPGAAPANRPTEAQLFDPAYDVLPWYWVPEAEVEVRLRDHGWQRNWLMGWRNVTDASGERTVIGTVFPRVGVTDTLPLFFTTQDPELQAAMFGCMLSLPFDYVARQKLGGKHLSQFYLEQLVAPAPEAYSRYDLDFVVPRVLELTYTSHSLAPFAADLGYSGPPFPWNPERRAMLRAELDAYFARLFGLARDELRFILDPADVYGEDYPTETFRVLKANEEKQFGEYRTRRLILEAWDRLFGMQKQ